MSNPEDLDDADERIAYAHLMLTEASVVRGDAREAILLMLARRLNAWEEISPASASYALDMWEERIVNQDEKEVQEHGRAGG